MKRDVATIILGLCFLLGAAQTSVASGFALYEWSSRGNALGGTLQGRADDPSAIAYNPAGLARLEGTQAQVGLSVIRPMAEVVINGETTKGKDNTWFPPHAYVTHRLNEKWGIGLGVYSRFGLGTEYEKEDWPGASNIYFASIETVSIAPTIAYRISDSLSLGVGIELMQVNLEMRKKLNPGMGPVQDGVLDASGHGVGLALGLHWQPDEQWRVGLTYKSQVEINASGTQKFDPGLGTILPTNTRGHGTVVLPDMLGIGLTYYPQENLSIEVGAMLTRWSTYRELLIHYDTPVAGKDSSSNPKKWNDVMRYSVGVEYGITDWLDLRAGYVYGESPVEDGYADFIVPGNDRQLFSVGAGFNWDSWTLDLSYVYLWMKGRSYAESTEVPTNSSAKDNYAHIYGLTLGYTF